YETASGCHVYDNLCFANGEAGIVVAGPSNVIAHNVCVSNRAGGLVLFRGGCRGNVIVNNIVADNLGGQILTDDGGGRAAPGAPAENVLKCNLTSTPAERPIFAEKPDARFDPRLQPASPGLGAAAAIDLRAAAPSPDAG